MSGTSSFDLTQLIGFNFNGLEASSSNYEQVSPGTYTTMPGDFNGNDSDPGTGPQYITNTTEQVIAATNGTALDGSPLQDPNSLGQIELQVTSNGAPLPATTFDVLGYSSDGKDILLGLTSSYNPGAVLPMQPYGFTEILADHNIDGNATPTQFPQTTQTYTATGTYVGGPFTAGGDSADLVTITNELAGKTIPSNRIVLIPAGNGITLNNDGSFTVKQTGTVLATGSATFKLLTTHPGTGNEGQTALQYPAPGGTGYFLVVGWNATQILLENVSTSGQPLSQPTYAILSQTNVPPQTAFNLSIGFTNFGTPPTAGAAFPCFVRGTRIATPDGFAPVESLNEGDLVLTVTGDVQTVTWVGSSRINTRLHAQPELVRPVRITAGAFEPNIPARDLFLSPDHAVFVADMLVPVKELINGTTIQQVDRTVVEYFHVELESHDVLLAEGLPAESYLDSGNRAALSGLSLATGGFGPDHNYMVWETSGYRPLTVAGEAVDAVRRVLVARADLLRTAAAV